MKDQLKFDFRVYAVIRSINPLSIYVSREGWNNYSIRTSCLYHNQIKAFQGSKRLLSTVFSQMTACGIRAKKLWHDVKLIVVKTVLAMLPELMIQYERTFSGMEGPQCFQIVGFDIMVRSDGFPILLEVNACPSLTIDHGGSDTEPRQRSVVDEVSFFRHPMICSSASLRMVELDIPKPIRTTGGIFAFLGQSRVHIYAICFFSGRYTRPIVGYQKICEVSWVNFERDCGYEGLFTPGGLEKKFHEICEYYEGNIQSEKGLFFHGFLSFMIYIADRQFSTVSLLKDRLQLLFDAVTNALRSKGVRSRRLRREEFDSKSGE
ncbi:unnamed protein product [Cylicostephanus goldi]|uniref:Tubulin--tyrosine ligase-like protein 9 n=1 Tax=Cylicostephanus goldi TaxID=71465 RepID=A0A3P7PUT1_CYLGO|nr:unnamed protein product [Cylicostephanus goldi]